MRSTIQKILLLLFLLFIFFYSISLLGSALKFFGSDFAAMIISTTENPVIGLFIGILATSVVQSSSTTTSVVVALAAGNILSLHNAIPIIMGANIGTSVTNTMISISYITKRIEFQRAASSAVVHDIFNFLSVLVLFPVQYYTDFLGKSSIFVARIFEGSGGLKFSSPIKTLVDPFVKLTITATGSSGILMVIIAFLCIFFVLRYISKIIKSLTIHRVEVFFDNYIFRTYFLSLLLGTVVTALVQSSSISTSLIIPLASAGILTLQQIYPYTLGANTGTAVTALLASFSTGNIVAVQIAFSHLLFNIFGITIFTALRKIPILLASKFSILIGKYRIILILYVIVLFFIIPILFISLL